MSSSLRDFRVVAGQQWGLVVPVKRLALAKSRLEAYGGSARQDLALAFACDVVAAGLACDVVTTVLVVTDDDRASRVLGALGATVVPDLPDAGLNPALTHGTDLLRAEEPGLGVASLSADLPAATAADLEEVLAQVGPGGRGFVCDAAATGTTLLAAGPGAALLASYGLRSAERHRASGAALLAGAPGLRRDVDTPDDLRDAFRIGVGDHTGAVVARLSFT